MRVFPAILAAVLLWGGGPAFAAASDWAANDHARVRLVAASDAVPRDGTLSLGLEFVLAPGWHVYWRSPGDAGVPPRLDWSGSENLKDAEIRWPLPERYTIFGLTTFVYGDEVVLPIAARAAESGRPVALRAQVHYLVCEKICVPYEAALTLDLPAPGGAGEAAPSAEAARIEAFAARVPPRLAPGETAPLSVRRAVLIADAGGPALELLVQGAAPLKDPDVLVEAPPGLRLGPPEVTRAADGMSALIRLPAAVAGQGGALPERAALTVTLADGGQAVEQDVTARFEGAGQATALAAILAVALLGGLILNLMPCVLPVLSLKLLSVIGHGGDVRAVRRGFLATAAGIVFSFWALAAGALALKGAGAAVGWGIQFQSPIFLGVMTVVLLLFAANLLGLYRIPLPGFVGRLASAAPEDQGALGGAFATGAFATLLATPCSAPFLGTALGFALSRGAAEILAVFTALGLGLALPYLAVAGFPGLARRLPRPGRWMGRLRAVLGGLLLATAAWLGTLIWEVTGSGAPPSAERPAVAGAIPWRPFDKVALHNLVAEGRTVFVDVTAEWCVTCKANKALVIERGAVARALEGGGVVPMQADWTRPDPAISAYLRSFGRFGIPFNVVYGPGAPQGIVLPELLTQAAVLDAFAAAGPTGRSQ